MNKQDLIAKLNRRDLPGVGAVATWEDGHKTYHFYEDFDTDKLGIDRAARDFSREIDRGNVRRVEYIYKDENKLHFWDWNERPGSSCANDEFIRYNKAHGIEYYYRYQRMIAKIGGQLYKYDATPAVDGIRAITATPA